MQLLSHYLPSSLLTIWALTAVLRPAVLPARTVIEAGDATAWKYFDGDDEPPGDWRQDHYDDSHWKSGNAPLGFGETRVCTRVNSGPDDQHRPITTYFRRRFNASQLEPGEGLVLLLCVDDGAVVYLNGQEIARMNMPEGRVDGTTLARRTIGNDEEGFYHRWHVPAENIHADQENLLAVEVHQATANSSDLFFDLALKVAPAMKVEAEVSAGARKVVMAYRTRHLIGPRVEVPDGYIDGGRAMQVDAAGGAASGREILMVDREHDKELAADLAFARSAALRALPPLERAQRVVARIDKRTTPPGGSRWVVETVGQLEVEFKNRPVLIGDWLDLCQAGVCRHRALLFKILADEAGLRASLVRGNFAPEGPPGLPHAWNELELSDGDRVLVDVMHNGGSPRFPIVTDPEVIKHYLKVDGTPWYGPEAK